MTSKMAFFAVLSWLAEKIICRRAVNSVAFPINVENKKSVLTIVRRVVFVWGWNTIGVIAVAVAGASAILSLGLVGIVTFAFLVAQAVRWISSVILR
jgi:hypothetical protein